jgi:hypothetical protein
VIGCILLKERRGIDNGSGSVIRLSGQLLVNCNKEIVRNVRGVPSELRRGIDDEGGEDGNE